MVQRASSPRGPSVLVGVVVGALVVGFLLWRGHAPAAAALAVFVVGMLVARRLSPAADRWFARVLVRVGHVVGLVLTIVLLGIVAVLFVFPVWALTRLLRWDTLDPAGDRGGWAPRPRPWEALPQREFANERRPRTLRSRLHGLALVAVPAVLVLVVAFPLRDEALSLRDRVRARLGDAAPFTDEPTAAPATGSATQYATTLSTIPFPSGDGPDGVARNGRIGLPDEPWVTDYIAEYFPVDLDYDPFLTVRPADTSGQYVNVSARARRTYTPPGAEDDPDALDVWFFGSSALFGEGQRDDHTIPSEVARLAEEDGLVLRIQNLACPGYRTWQDALLMGQLLTERPNPDLIVTYEGFNDLMYTLLPGSRTEVDAGWSDDVRRALRESGAEIGGTTDEDDPIPHTNGTSPQNAGIIYNRSARFARDIAGARGIPLVQTLQPSVFTRDLAVDDATLANVGADREWHDSFGGAMNQARTLMAVDGVIDLGDSLDGLDQLVYQDLVHHNETAARVVAEALYAHLRPRLEELAGAAAAEPASGTG